MQALRRRSVPKSFPETTQFGDGDMPEYRLIEGWPGYRVGDDGSVWSCKTRGGNSCLASEWHLLKQTINTTGYPLVGLRRGRKILKLVYVHALVLGAFVGPAPEGMQCCHHDGNKCNNVLDNLRWGTRLENAADTERHGRRRRGQNVYGSKLTENAVREIFRLSSAGQKNREIAERFGVTRRTIRDILRRVKWRHVVI